MMHDSRWDRLLERILADPDAPEGIEFFEIHRMERPRQFFEVTVNHLEFRPLDVDEMPVVSRSESMLFPKSGDIDGMAYCYTWIRGVRRILVWTGTREQLEIGFSKATDEALLRSRRREEG